jgi:ribose transport system substrate-binding protein
MMTSHQRIASIAFLLLLSITTFSCRPESDSKPEVLTIAWIPKSLDNPIFELGHNGAVQRAAELSLEGKIQVEIYYAGSVSSDTAEQMAVFDNVVARGVDAIAISCNDATACIDPINRAVEAGIPVMTWDSDAPDSKRFTYFGVDNYLAGKAAGNLLVSAIRGKGQVAILNGTPGALNLEERIRGFKDVAAIFPEIEIVATVFSNDDINTGVQVVEETMRAYPDLDGWFFAGMWPLFAERGSMPVWEESAKNSSVKTVAFDTLPLELQLLKDGYISGLVGQKYWEWGYDSVQMLYDHIVKKRNFPSFYNSGINIVTSENVDLMLQAWENGRFGPTMPEP